MIKICKECGLEFEAKNARQQYCNRDHYRPCPVCGQKVLIKYLSDPTPRCKDCRQKRTTVTTPANVASNDVLDETTIKIFRYIGSTLSGWATHNVYEVKLHKRLYGYVLLSTKNLTTGEVVNLYTTLHTLEAVRRNFEEVSDIACIG